MKKAFIFDMNGTMIDDMHYHAQAWYKVFRELGSTKTEQQIKQETYGKSEEIFRRVLGENHGFTQEEIQEISRKKEEQYRKDFLPQLKLINGLDSFLAKAYSEDIPMSIGTAAPPSNIDFVFENLPVGKYFTATVDASQVEKSKPDPEVFLKCAALMNASPEDCIVFEDAPKGVEAAANAGMKAIALTTFHEEKDFLPYKNVLFVIRDYTDERLENLLK